MRTWEPLAVGPEVGSTVIEVSGLLVMVGSSGGGPDCGIGCTAAAWRSLDGGRTWIAVPTDGSPGTMTDVAALPDGTLVAVGRVNKSPTSPIGAAWVSIPTGSSQLSP
jgi:hypothetical protein